MHHEPNPRRGRERQRLIASMVAIASRQATLQQVIDSVSRQTRRPDLFLLYYSRTRWHLDQGWRSAPRVRADFPLELREVPNVGSARKYLTTLALNRNCDTHVVLLDDDRIWAPYVFERLLRHAARTGELVTTRGWSKHTFVKDDAGRREILLNEAVDSSDVSKPRAVRVANSGWATLFHVKHVDDRLFDRTLQRAYQLRYSDEVFLAAMLNCRKSVVPLPRGFSCEVGPYAAQWQNPKTSSAKLKQLELLERCSSKR